MSYEVDPGEMMILRSTMEEMERVFNVEKAESYDGNHLMSDWQIGFGDGIAFSLLIGAQDRADLLPHLLASLLEELIELKKFRDGLES